MFPWGHAPAEVSGPNDASGLGGAPETPTYAVGDVIYSGPCRGLVISVDPGENAMGVIWDDSHDRYGVITYPADATYLRKALPWE